MTIFDFKDYKEFLTVIIRQKPKKGHGQARKLAEELGVSSVVVSQVLKGHRDFTLEQAIKVAKFFAFPEKETEYFILMVNFARAGTKDLKDHFSGKMENAQETAESLRARVAAKHELTDPQKALFYSNWFYSGIRLLSSIPGYNDVDTIADYLKLDRQKVAEAVAFLLETGLCKEDNGKLSMGISSTYIDATSPFVNNHRRNWRIKGLDSMTRAQANEVFFSGLFSLSVEDVETIRKEIVAFISGASKKVVDSPEETLACLNIDWFRV